MSQGITVYTQKWVAGIGWQTLSNGTGRALDGWRKYRELYAENIAYEFGDDVNSVLYTVVSANGRTMEMCAGDGKNFFGWII